MLHTYDQVTARETSPACWAALCLSTFSASGKPASWSRSAAVTTARPSYRAGHEWLPWMWSWNWDLRSRRQQRARDTIKKNNKQRD